MRSAVRNSGAALSSRMRAPRAAWVLTTSNSSSVRRSGLSRMCSGTAILPMSCSGAAARISSTSTSSSPNERPSRAAIAPTRWVCSQVLSSRYSPASASRVERVVLRVGGGPVARDGVGGQQRLEVPHPRAQPVALEPQREPVEHDLVPDRAGRGARAARPARRPAGRRRWRADRAARTARRRSRAAPGSRPAGRTRPARPPRRRRRPARPRRRPARPASPAAGPPSRRPGPRPGSTRRAAPNGSRLVRVARHGRRRLPCSP